jgi:hypothetical protein
MTTGKAAPGVTGALLRDAHSLLRCAARTGVRRRRTSIHPGCGDVEQQAAFVPMKNARVIAGAAPLVLAY